MTFTRRLLVAELQAQAALLACAVLVAAGLGLVALFAKGTAGHSAHEVASLLLLAAAGTYVYGLLPVALYGAPLYAIADHLGRAKWLVVAAIGALPGAILVPFTLSGESTFSFTGAIVAIACGLFVSVATHLLYRRAKGVPGGV
jgi:hypothetical protein